jgi:hypothetical protein
VSSLGKRKSEANSEALFRINHAWVSRHNPSRFWLAMKRFLMAKLYVSINTVAHNFGDLNHHWALDGTAYA